MRVLVDKATGRPRLPVSAKQVLAALREKRKVSLPAASLLLPAPLATLGEHEVRLRFDTAHIPGQHAMTVHLKKKL
jgi:ribosomal protein L9